MYAKTSFLKLLVTNFQNWYGKEEIKLAMKSNLPKIVNLPF